MLLLTGLRDALAAGQEIRVNNESRNEHYAVRHSLSKRQVEMLLAGGLIPWLREWAARPAPQSAD